MVSPCPFVSIVIIVHSGKTGIHTLQTVNLTAFNAVYQLLHFTFGSNQTGNIHPFAYPDFRIRLQTPAYLFIIFKVDPFKTLDDGVAKKLMDGYLVIAYTAIQRGVFNFGTLIRVDFRSLARHPLQLFQDRASLKHLLNGIRTEKVIVDIIQTVRVCTFVTFRPLLGITDCTHTTQVDSRHQIRGILLLNQVGERQVRCIGMVHMTPHHQRKSAYTGRP